MSVTPARAAELLPPGPAGWETNGGLVYELQRYWKTNLLLKLHFDRMATNPAAPTAARRKPPSFLFAATNRVFSHYTANSLNHLVWTNFVALTNEGRNTLIWSRREHPIGWPKRPPIMQWNKSSLLYGMRGFTALSPCWTGEGSPGQVPITALTRRHGYARGHGMGPDGYTRRFNGEKAWFVTANDQRVEVKILASVVRTAKSGRDYGVLLFDRDLPDGIRPLRVASEREVRKHYRIVHEGTTPVFQTEQSGHVSSYVAPLALPVAKGGDSGSPDMLPIPGELVFFRGRSTSGPSQQMQEDMDELCRREGLEPKKYQMEWFDEIKDYPPVVP